MSKTNDSIESLKREIRMVARAAGEDQARKDLIARAHAAGVDVIPDAWAEDGALRDGQAAWTVEQRETANDVFVALQGALEDALDGQFSSWSIWVQDWDGGGDGGYRVIYCAGSDLYAAPFEFDDANKVIVGVGEAVKVRPITTYVERQRSATLEWRKRKADELRGLERREFALSDVEIREKDDGTWNLTGYASVTETPYEVGFYTETIKRGAFKRTLSENPDVQLLVNHEGLPLARTRSGTLRLEEREKGLWVDADLDMLDPDAQRLQRKMVRGDIDQMSFAFQVTDQAWNEDYTDRTIKSVSIHRGDVSVVNQGANPATVATIRSAQAVDALRRLGGEAIIDAFVEWRDYTLLPVEQRAGKTLSASTMEVLTQVLSLTASADEALDEAQPLLADLMGVANPDADADDDGAGGEPEETDGDDTALRDVERLRMLRRNRDDDEQFLLEHKRKAA